MPAEKKVSALKKHGDGSRVLGTWVQALRPSIYGLKFETYYYFLSTILLIKNKPVHYPTRKKGYPIHSYRDNLSLFNYAVAQLQSLVLGTQAPPKIFHSLLYLNLTKQLSAGIAPRGLRNHFLSTDTTLLISTFLWKYYRHRRSYFFLRFNGYRTLMQLGYL